MKKDDLMVMIKMCDNIIDIYKERLLEFEKLRVDSENLDKLILDTLNDIKKYEKLKERLGREIGWTSLESLD